MNMFFKSLILIFICCIKLNAQDYYDRQKLEKEFNAMGLRVEVQRNKSGGILRSILLNQGNDTLVTYNGGELKYSGDSLMQSMSDYRYGMIKLTGESILLTKFDMIQYLGDGHFSCQYKGKCGLYSIEKGWLLDFEYDYIYRRNNKYIILHKDNKEDLFILNYKRDSLRFKYIRDESKRSLYGYTFDDKSVLLDSMGNEASKYYDEIKEISSEQFSLYKVRLNNNEGAIDIHGQEIIKPIYEEIEDLEDLGFMVKSGENYGVLNMAGKTVVPFVHKSEFGFEGMNSIYYKFMDKLYDYNGQQKYEFDHDHINEDYQNYILTFTKNQKKGIYNIIEKKIVIEAIYDDIYPYGVYWNNKKFIVTIGDCYGLVDIKGNPIYKTVYERIVYDQNTNLIALKYDSLFYIYNSKGNLISPMGFEEVRFNSYEPIVVKRNGFYGAINKSGKVVIEFKYTELDFIDLNPGEWFNYSVCKPELFPENLYGFSYIGNIDSTYYPITKEGNVLKVENLDKGKVKRYQNSLGFYGLKDKTGKILIEAKWAWMYYFNDSILVCVNRQKERSIYSLVDHKMTNSYYAQKVYYIPIPIINRDGFIYSNLDNKLIFKEKVLGIGQYSYSDDLFCVLKGDKIGFTNLSGELKIPFTYEHDFNSYHNLPYFINGFSIVKKNGKYGIINTKNKTIVGFDFDTYLYNNFMEDYILVRKNGKWSKLDFCSLK